MKARVVSIESGSAYADRQRRIGIKFVGVSEWEIMYSTIKVTESALGIAGLKLDDELDVGFTPVKLYAGLAEEGLRAAGERAKRRHES